MGQLQDEESILTVGERLEQAKREHGFSQTELARISGLTDSQISELKTGNDTTRLTIKTVVKCMKGLINLHAITTPDEINDWLFSYFTQRREPYLSVEELGLDGRELLQVLQEAQERQQRAQALRDKLEYYQMRGQRKKETITYEVIEREAGLANETISRLMRGYPELTQPGARTNLLKIIRVLVEKKAMLSRDEADDFLQTVFPDDRLREDNDEDREINDEDREIIELLNRQTQQAQPPLSPSAPPARRFTLTRRAFFIIGLVVIVVLAVGSGLTLRLRNGPAPAPSPTPTVAVALTPGPYGIPVGQSLLDDPLVTNTQVTNIDKRWQEGTSDHNGSCRFRTGGYDVKATAYHTYCKDTTDVFINFVLQVDMSLIGQSEGRVLFRATLRGGGYYFGIDDLGNYQIGKNNSNNKQPIKQVINQDTPENTYDLIIVADGSSFAIYINGKPLDHFDDPSYKGGYIALAADGVAPPYTQPNTEVLFTNLKVWQR